MILQWKGKEQALINYLWLNNGILGRRFYFYFDLNCCVKKFDTKRTTNTCQQYQYHYECCIHLTIIKYSDDCDIMIICNDYICTYVCMCGSRQESEILQS